jgi:tRNA (guanine37-N1)-methyltransferase
MFGIYDNNQLAGFIGVHSEGSIGMLEIFPEYRRRGFGYILEAFVIEKLLDLGYTPYCHVVEGNAPSYKLQEKLGYKKADKLSIWININKNPSN